MRIDTDDFIGGGYNPKFFIYNIAIDTILFALLIKNKLYHFSETNKFFKDKMMENIFEKILKERCESSSYEVLLVQWHAAKTYIPNILSMIGNIFPHYSLHDATHSEKILSNICRILGENQIRGLSTTDIWMLLFVAYFHDIGMFVSRDDIIKTVNEKEFLQYINEKKQDSSSEMNVYANLFEVKEDGLHYCACKFSSESFYALRYLLADYLRTSHSDRSKRIIQESSFIYIPESIPKRIFDLLANICCYHAKDFSNIMGLQLKENGFLDDDCHPRFIACMLRLGDVLDVDNDRFSSIVLSTLPSIPTESLLHIEKHLSISTLYIGSAEIMLEAHCKSIDVGELTNSWFKWIADEIDNQTKNWHSIIPNNTFAPLPLIKKLNVYIDGYDAVNSNGNYKFSFDSSKALSFIQGAGFYGTKFIFVRELLQNATDATYLRVYLENKSIKEKGSFDKECKKHPIHFCISEDKKHPEILKIKVKDSGVGIDKDDFESILNSGKKNKWKKQLVKEMPEWMKPSGAFGVGLHSIFPLADSFEIFTTKKNGGRTISGIVFSPTSQRNGSIYLKNTKAEAGAETGTEISFEYKSCRIPTRLTLSSAHPNLMHQFHNYDFTNSENENFELAEIVDEVFTFAMASNVPIILKVNKSETDVDYDSNFEFFDAESGFEFNIRNNRTIRRMFYRNQLLKKANWLDLYFISTDVNILSGDADQMLLMNRDDLKEEFKPEFLSKLIPSLKKTLRNNFDSIDKALKPFVAMFLDLNDDIEDAIRQCAMNFPLSQDCLVSNILECDVIDVKRNEDKREIWVKENKIFDDFWDSASIRYIEEKLKQKGYYLSILIENNKEILRYSKQEPNSFIPNKKWLVETCLKYQSNARCVLPCEPEFKKLKLRKDFVKSVFFGRVVPAYFHYEYFKGGYMIFPYRYVRKDGFNRYFELDERDAFYEFVKKNLENDNVTIEEIKDEYKKFVESYKGLLPLSMS